MVLADEGKDYQMFSRCHSMARARDYDDSRSIIRLKWDEGIFDFAAHDFFFFSLLFLLERVLLFSACKKEVLSLFSV